MFFFLIYCEDFCTYRYELNKSTYFTKKPANKYNSDKNFSNYSPIIIAVAQIRHDQWILEERILSGIEPVHAREPLTGWSSYKHFYVALLRQVFVRSIAVHHETQKFVAIVGENGAVRVVYSECLGRCRFFFNLRVVAINNYQILVKLITNSQLM